MRNFCAITFVFILFFVNALPASVMTGDSINVLAIRVAFQADESNTTTGNGTFDLSVSGDAYQVDPPPHNRAYFEDHLQFLHNYFKKISRGSLTVNGTVFPVTQDDAYQLDHPMGFYNSNTTQDEINKGLARLVKDALQKADADPDIHFADYQSVVIFHAGVGKDIALGFDETPQDIPSFFVNSNFLQTHIGQSAVLVDDSIEISSALLLPETESQEGLELGINGVLVSNFASRLGWLDLFNPQTRRPGIGRFGLMDAGLFNGDGVLPAVPCAWTRINAGWETPIDITYAQNDEFTIYHSTSANSRRVYRIPINANEYFLIENRYSSKKTIDEYRFEMQQNRNDYPSIREVLTTYFADEVTFSPRGVLIDMKNPDLGLSGNGCLIWHIDENVIREKAAENRINDDESHKGVDLEEADGSQDIGYDFEFLSAGSGSENGWVLDMWYAGNEAPLFKSDNNTFAPNTVPNSRSYRNRANSHIAISNFSEADSVMTFRVNFNLFEKDFPRKLDPAIYGTPRMIKTADLDGDKKEDVILSTDQGKILAIQQDLESIWNNGSLEIADLGPELIHPVAFFEDNRLPALDARRMVALTTSGKIYGFAFSAEHQIDTLFAPIDCGRRITTMPVVQKISTLGNKIFWATEDGRIYQLSILGSELPPDTSSYRVAGPVKFLHVDASGDVIAVTAAGDVYKNDQAVFRKTSPAYRPMGNTALSVDASGSFRQYQTAENIRPADQGVFSYQSAPVSYDYFQDGDVFSRYFVTAENRLLSYNYNLVISENFPVKIYQPDQSKNMIFSPVIGDFLNASGQLTEGIVIADENGLIDGFDFQGNRLANFPLNAGETPAAAPLLTDLDGDGDVEILLATVSGRIYAWDLQGSFNRTLWHQPFADGYNSNRILTVQDEAPGQPFAADENSLMPAKKAYNWPNPNIDNFTFIRYYLSAPAQVHIKIFDLAGDLVMETQAPGEGHTANEYRWDLSGIESGVYLANVEAKSSGKSAQQIIKIAVIK